MLALIWLQEQACLLSWNKEVFLLWGWMFRRVGWDQWSYVVHTYVDGNIQPTVVSLVDGVSCDDVTLASSWTWCHSRYRTWLDSCVQIPCVGWSLIPTLSGNSRECNSRKLLVLGVVETYWRLLFSMRLMWIHFPRIVNIKIAMSDWNKILIWLLVSLWTDTKWVVILALTLV